MNFQDPGKLIKTLHLSPQEQAEVLESLGRDGQPSPEGLNRRAVRVPYRARAVIVLLTHPGQATVKYSVVPRNLSARGLAFIHGQFVHPQSACRTIMPNLAGQWVVVTGRIARCRHVRGLIHEVSVVFQETLDLSEFVAMPEKAPTKPDDPMGVSAGGDARSSEVPLDPSAIASLAGRVLVADDFAGDRRLFGFWLSKRGATVLEAGDAESVRRAVDEGPIDLILMDLHLGTESGLGVVRRLREHGFTPPVVAISADTADESQAAALAAGCNAFLPKPCDRARFLETVEQLLRFDLGTTEHSPIRSALADDSDMAPLVKQFADGLAATIQELLKADAGNDLAALRTLCQQLKGSAASYGFEPISDAARTATARLQASPPDRQAIRRAVSDLVETLRRVAA